MLQVHNNNHLVPSCAKTLQGEVVQAGPLYGETAPLYSLEELVEYIKSVEKSKPVKTEYGSRSLIPLIKNKVTLVYSHYLKTSIPSPDMVNLLKSNGMIHHTAQLGGTTTEGEHISPFSRTMCLDCGAHIFPNVTGGRHNPFVSYQRMKSSACRATNKVTNLLADPTVVSLVLTYPKEISEFLAEHPGSHSATGTAMRIFKNKLEHLKCEQKEIMGMSENLHIWKSSDPCASPHYHHHVIIPWLALPWPKENMRRYVENKVNGKVKLLNIIKTEKEEIEKELRLLGEGDLNTYSKIISLESELISFEKMIEHERLEINQTMTDILNVRRIPWERKNGKNVPVSDTVIKRLWRESLEETFKGFVIPDNIDVYIKYYNTPKTESYSSDRAKILHAMRYKSRRPILDLALYLDKNPIKNFEWSSQVVKYKNKTRTWGWWKVIKRVMKIDSPDKEDICETCGSLLMSKGYPLEKVKKEEIDVVIRKNGGSLYVFKPPPPDNLIKSFIDTSVAELLIDRLRRSLKQRVLYDWESVIRMGFTDSQLEHSLKKGYLFEPKAGRLMLL